MRRVEAELWGQRANALIGFASVARSRLLLFSRFPSSLIRAANMTATKGMKSGNSLGTAVVGIGR